MALTPHRRYYKQSDAFYMGLPSGVDNPSAVGKDQG